MLSDAASTAPAEPDVTFGPVHLDVVSLDDSLGFWRDLMGLRAQDRHLGLPRPAQLREDVVDDMIQLLPALRRIPRRLDHITGALEHGELSLRIRPFAHPHDTDFIVRLTNRLILAFFTASIGLVAVFLLRTGGGPKLFGKQVDELLGYGGLVASTILGLRVIVAVSRDGG